jgi:hypothetical protein
MKWDERHQGKSTKTLAKCADHLPKIEGAQSHSHMKGGHFILVQVRCGCNVLILGSWGSLV